MNEISTSRPGDWDHVLQPTHGVSHRSTTSSRQPGKAIEGNVHYRIRTISPCRDCGGMTYESNHPHGVRWVLVGARHAKLDCAGREVA